MSTSLNSSFSGALLSPYARQILSDVAQQPGAKVTANYEVDARGKLALRQLQVQSPQAETEAVTPVTREGRKGDKNASPQSHEGGHSALLSPSPRAQLFPTEEAGLFAVSDETLHNSSTKLPRSSSGFSPSFSGAAAPRSALVPESLAAQQQRNVALLYHKNSDAIYQMLPLVSEAI